MTGKEVAPPKELTKNQLKLKEKVELYRAEQKKKKEEERLRREAEKSAARQLAKEQKRDEKQSVRIESRLLRAAEKQQKSTERETRRAEKELPSDGRDYAQLPRRRGRRRGNRFDIGRRKRKKALPSFPFQK